MNILSQLRLRPLALSIREGYILSHISVPLGPIYIYTFPRSYLRSVLTHDVKTGFACYSCEQQIRHPRSSPLKVCSLGLQVLKAKNIKIGLRTSSVHKGNLHHGTDPTNREGSPPHRKRNERVEETSDTNSERSGKFRKNEECILQ